MKKVVDACAINSPLLAEFLSDSSQNKAVLTDYLAMESLKGNSEVNIRKSLGIIYKFSDQVIVLKSTNEISRLRPRGKGLHNRLMDRKQTDAFGHYCRMLFGPSNSRIRSEIISKGILADGHFAKMLTSAETVRAGISTLMASYKEEDLKALRLRIPISAAFSERIVKDILMTTAMLYRNLGYKREEMPQSSEVIFSYPFRYTVCCYALALKWITDGGHTAVAVEKLRNDCVDMTYAAYGTFFDGLITTDKKAGELYSLAHWMLLNVFL